MVTDIHNTQATNWAGSGTTTIPNGWAGQPYNAPNTCPGCGRCRDCGRPYETQPYSPWPGYPNPYIGDWPGLGGTWISSAGNVTCPTITGLQAWN